MHRQNHFARNHAARRSGFTLIEILIVVIILGILAAIVIPQFSSASEDARSSSLGSQLQALRSQVALYRLEHNDDYPTSNGKLTGTWDWDLLTGKTDKDGTKNTSGNYGPYLQSVPTNPLNDKSAVIVNGTVTTDHGFAIDANGKVFATGKHDGATVYWFNEVTQESFTGSTPTGYATP
ncbi:MAG: prepilin-type N-terminal cleavage/methylation domain-containing protein [Planctomycetota bacterium]